MNITSICNMALSMIAQGTIADLNENSEAARQCRIYYENSRREVLARYPWNFARRFVKLAILDTSIPGYEYAYSFPSACIAVRKVYNEYRDEGDYLLAAENDSTRIICTDIEEACCEYTGDVKNAEVFTHTFITALAHYLAYCMAIPLTGDPQKQQMQYQLFNNAIYQASVEDARESDHTPEYPTKYFDARK